MILTARRQTVTAEVAFLLREPLVETAQKFNDGEARILVPKADSYVFVQSLCPPNQDELLLELSLSMQAAREFSNDITLVLPYCAYLRQDRTTREGEPVSAKLVAELLKTASKTFILEAHSPRALSYFHNVQNIDSFSLAQNIECDVIVSPDQGGVGRAKKIAEERRKKFGSITKTRPEPGKAEAKSYEGDSLKGKKVLLLDDIVDSGGSLIKAAEFLKEKGASQVKAFCTHAILSNNAGQRIQDSVIDELIVSNSIPQENLPPKIKVENAAGLIANSLKHTNPLPQWLQY